jgi:hypothetical protein
MYPPMAPINNPENTFNDPLLIVVIFRVYKILVSIRVKNNNAKWAFDQQDIVDFPYLTYLAVSRNHWIDVHINIDRIFISVKSHIVVVFTQFGQANAQSRLRPIASVGASRFC